MKCKFKTSTLFSTYVIISLTATIAIGRFIVPVLERNIKGEGSGGIASYVPIDTSGATTYSTFLKHYFDNLTTNFGMNYQNSCGYVALGMLLSYYDTYFDGLLVPSAYDIKPIAGSMFAVDRRNSPGILHDCFENTGYSNVDTSLWDNDDYLDYYYDISDVSLHAKLITIGDDLGILNYYGGTSFYTENSTRIDILNSYLQDYLNIDSSDYSITYYEVPNGGALSAFLPSMKTAIKNLVDSGHPVVVSLTDSGGSGGHVVVVYDYEIDGSNINLYCHPGWSAENSTSHTLVGSLTDMPYIKSYLAIDFDYIAIKGYNYGVQYIFQSNPVYYKYTSMVWQQSYNSPDPDPGILHGIGDNDYETE